ncbi:MAG: 30S ribosomal protein S20 [Bacilli bacterium]|jgi:small subunit ribosomal protein S20
MPNIKSQIKRVKTNEKARNRNAQFKSSVRTAIKKTRLAIEAKDKELAEKNYLVAISLIDRAVTKNIIHKNKAARLKSNLTLSLNELN